MKMLSEEKNFLIGAFGSPTIESFNQCSYQENYKNLKASEETRLEANKLFKNIHTKKLKAEHYEEIWAKYTLSVALALEKSSTQAFAYAERSAFLIRLGKFEESILDIDQAIHVVSLNYHKAMFLCIKVVHLIAMKFPFEKSLRAAESYANQITDKNKKYKIMNVIEKIEQNNALISDDNNNEMPSLVKNASTKRSKTVQVPSKRPNDFSSVVPKYTSKHGKHLVAAHDIQPGDVIFVEKPYVTTLNLTKVHPICSYCFATCWSCVACDSCTSNMYCSEKCKREAWNWYHSFECVVLTNCRWSRFYDVFSLSTRLLILGLREAGSIEKLKDLVRSAERDSAEDPMKNFVRNNNVAANGFKSIINLSCDINQTSTNVMETYSIIAVQILICLAKRTEFFGKKFDTQDFSDLTRNEDVVFIGSLILKLVKISHLCKTKMINSSIDTISTCDYVKDVQSHKTACLATIFSLINHSCDPNVSACFDDKNEIVVYALRPIKKDEQIFKSYIYNYYSAVDYNRKSFLVDTYNFVCDCDACEGNWPELPFPSKSMKKGFYNYIESLCERPFEKEIHQKYSSLLTIILKRNNNGVRYHKEIAHELSQFVTIASAKLPRYSIVYRLLNLILNLVFSKVYGNHITFSDDSVDVTYPFSLSLQDN